MKSKTLLAALVLGLAALSVRATPCAPSATSLCLASGRFEVSVAWKDFQGKTGVGQAIPLTAETGYFWFFTSNNIELIVKVLDARGINHKFWVFFGALSSVEYDLTVRDSVSNLTKHYHNPSGQFASLGDTAAFDGSAGVVLVPQEAVTVQGTAAAPGSIGGIQRFIDRAAPLESAFTPCAADGPSLYLANCRFRVEVDWTDSGGKEGAGHAVQLTSDTGYFWFFNDTNVELMVKVLDARGIGGKFWVFFGALSNVEYTITVIDTVSGALRTYQNPANTFASVGDTSAFRGGYGIPVETDDALAVTGTITAAGGGSLSAAAADGTLFTLEVPPDAIFQDQDITMTPVRTAHVPFAGGLAAGVDLQPSGLLLLTGGRLTIHPPAPMSRSEETPVGWNGSGEDFFLVPPDPTGGDLTLFVPHFGGYGVARGTDAERATQLQREPVEDSDLLGHRMSPLLRAGRVAAAGVTGGVRKAASDLNGDVKAAFDNWFGTLYVAMLGSSGEPAEVVQLITQVQDWRARVLHYLGQVDAVWPGRDQQILSQYERLVKLALAKIHEKCSRDPAEIGALPAIASLVKLLGLNVQAEVDAAMGCLTFKLVFNSQIHGFSKLAGYGDLDILDQVQATLTLRTPRYFSLTSGEGTIDHTVVSITGIPSESGCTYTRTSGPGPFKAAIQWSNLYNASGGRVTVQWLFYNPGRPPSNVTLQCPRSPAIPLNLTWWAEFFVLNTFTGAPEYPFKKGDWTVPGGPDPWAKANQLHNSQSLLEVTNFTLTHTPE